MRERLKKPGYWILFSISILLAFYLYEPSEGKVKKSEENRTVQKIFGFADTVFEALKKRDSYELQRHFSKEERRKIALEDVAFFLDTVEFDRNISAVWNDCNVSDENVSLSGTAKGDGKNYRVQMMLIHKGDRIVLKAIRVGEKSLSGHNIGFPFECEREESDGDESNISKRGGVIDGK